ncbi:UNVERIFIED_CONTAM: hypothetical protein FKN15_018877 [Acipenser sinensis]
MNISPLADVRFLTDQQIEITELVDEQLEMTASQFSKRARRVLLESWFHNLSFYRKRWEMLVHEVSDRKSTEPFFSLWSGTPGIHIKYDPASILLIEKRLLYNNDLKTFFTDPECEFYVERLANDWCFAFTKDSDRMAVTPVLVVPDDVIHELETKKKPQGWNCSISIDVFKPDSVRDLATVKTIRLRHNPKIKDILQHCRDREPADDNIETVLNLLKSVSKRDACMLHEFCFKHTPYLNLCGVGLTAKQIRIVHRWSLDYNSSSGKKIHIEDMSKTCLTEIKRLMSMKDIPGLTVSNLFTSRNRSLKYLINQASESTKLPHTKRNEKAVTTVALTLMSCCEGATMFALFERVNVFLTAGWAREKIKEVVISIGVKRAKSSCKKSSKKHTK